MSTKSNAFFDQEMRCRAALKMIDVPEAIIWQLSGPILFQVAHLCCVIDQPMHWKDALRWCHDHKGEILNHAMEMEKQRTAPVEQNFTRPQTNRKIN